MEFILLGLKIKTSFLSFGLIVCTIILLDISGSIGFWIFLAIFLHEMAHILTMCAFKCKPKEIRLRTFDIAIIENNQIRRSFLKDFLVFLSGPLTNIFLALFFLILYFYLNFQILLEIFLVNITLGIFNLLPIAFLDGGKILKLILDLNFDIRKSKNILIAITIVSVIILFLLGIVGIYFNNFNLSILFLPLYIIFMLLTRRKSL